MNGSTMNLSQLEVWFVTGSQHLYGAEALAKVAENSQKIATSLDAEGAIPVKIVERPLGTRLSKATELRHECASARPPHSVGRSPACSFGSF